MDQKKNSVLFFFLLMCFFVVSCNEKLEFNKYQSINNNSWKANEKVSFQFNITDTLKPKNIFINLRNTKEYEFSNLYLITELKFPDGKTIVDTLQYEMADASGKFLGDGFTHVKDNKLFYKEHKIFPISGKYEFNVRQAMRKNGEVNPIPFLKGVQDVGFSIEKVN